MVSCCASLHIRSLYRPLRCARFPASVPALSVTRRKESTQASLRNCIHPDELEQLLANPTWSVESLLPPKERIPDAPQIKSQQLHHLLRISALPPPETPEQEWKMLDTLAAQLYFVGKVQEVDTTSVEPLRAIRDETAAAEEEQTISVTTLLDALKGEQVIGTHYKRIQRGTTAADAKDVEEWDVLGLAERKAGKYFVVESERSPE